MGKDGHMQLFKVFLGRGSFLFFMYLVCWLRHQLHRNGFERMEPSINSDSLNELPMRITHRRLSPLSCCPPDSFVGHGLLFDRRSDPPEVHWLLPSLWARVRPLVGHHPAGWSHAAFRQRRHESGTTPLWIWTRSLKRRATNLLAFDFPLLPFSLSSSQSSWTPSIRPTPWPSFAALPTRKSASAPEENTTTWTMLARTSTTTPSLRCWGPGPLGTTSR